MTRGNKLWIGKQCHLCAIRVSSFNGTGKIFAATIGVTASPQVVVGERPSDGTLPLPPLENISGAGFHVVLDVLYPQDEASIQLNKSLKDKRVIRGDKYIEITDASVYGTGSNKAVLQIKFRGTADGTIYFVGEPQFDAFTNELQINDLEYDIKTKNVLLEVADWLYHTDVRDFFKTRSKWNVTKELTTAKSTLTGALNRDLGDSYRVSGNVNSVGGVGIRVTPENFIVRVRADGIATIAK